jgi:hypothetical protein
MHDYESLSRPKWECKYHVVLLGARGFAVSTGGRDEAVIKTTAATRLYG